MKTAAADVSSIDKEHKNNMVATTNSNSIFKGVIGAIVRLDLASNLMKKIQLEKNLILLPDNNGTIESSDGNQIIGKSIFDYSSFGDDSIFSQSTSTKVQSIDDFIQRALYSRYSTRSDFPERNGMIKSSIVSESVMNHGIHLWNPFSIAPHTLSHNVNILFEQQNYFSTVMIIIVGIVALAIVFLILLWNRELESTVEARTMELKKTNNYLIAANEQLKIRGLDPDLISSLFTKFATNSDQGVGLGLYTSKNIIMVEKYGQKTIKIREVQPFHLLCHYPK